MALQDYPNSQKNLPREEWGLEHTDKFAAFNVQTTD